MRRLLRRVNAWVLRPSSPPDALGDALFMMNKMMLVYVLPVIVLAVLLLAVVAR